MRCQDLSPSVRYAQKAIPLHVAFDSELVQNSHYEMITLHSMKNLQHANDALGRNNNQQMEEDIETPKI